jgi:HEAT repeat protein
MDSIFNLLAQLGPVAGAVLKAILASLLGIFLLIAFIILRRWYRGRYFRRLNERTLEIREVWPDILSGRISPKSWIQRSLDRQIVESILLDSIEIASAECLPQLLSCLRSSGLLDARIQQARSFRGWQKRIALLALGRTRAPEAVPALAESLDAELIETRTAAVRAVGSTGLREAAIALLNAMQAAPLNVPDHTLKNALANCCGSCPGLLLTYMQRSSGPERELLARVLGELATPELGDDLLVLSADHLPEVRASAARALANAQPRLALPALRALAGDPEWFVRLRAVVALGSLPHPERRGILVRTLCDPNRLVRQRAAWVLARMEPQLEQILEDVVETRDRYALQSFISELERSGEIETLIGALGLSSDPRTGRQILLETLENAAHDLDEAATAPAMTTGAH